MFDRVCGNLLTRHAMFNYVCGMVQTCSHQGMPSALPSAAQPPYFASISSFIHSPISSQYPLARYVSLCSPSSSFHRFLPSRIR